MSEIGAIIQTGVRHQAPDWSPAGVQSAVRDRQGLAGPGKAAAAEPAAPSAFAVQADAAVEAVAQLNAFLRHERLNLEFSVDEGSGRVVIRITDTDTDQLVRQIPSEEVLTIARHLAEGSEAGTLRGLLVSESV